MEDFGGELMFNAMQTALPPSPPPLGAATNDPRKTTSSTSAKVTPKKRGAKVHGDADDDEVGDDEEDATPKKKAKTTPKSGTPKQRKTPTNPVAGARAIPRSIDECSEADKMLIALRDAGKGWTEIRVEWEKMTGERTGNSTLPNRYSRLKSNLTIIKEEDNQKLLEAKQEVEATFEKDKWSMIAQNVAQRGGEAYKADVLQRQYKKLMVAAQAGPPAGVKDKDLGSDEE